MATELEMLERARSYIDALARGMDPISGQEAPENDVINQVRLSRCFFYVSEVLGKVIENGGVSAPMQHREKVKKQPFSLPPAQRELFPISQEPIPVSRFTERINGLTQKDTMLSLSHTQITEWLIDAGFLEEFLTPEGHHIKRATAQAEPMGIRNEECMGRNGPYRVVLYDAAAQKFLLDNLDSILSFSAQRTQNEGKDFTPEENDLILSLFRQGTDPEDISRQLRRKPASIKHQLKNLGP